MKDVTAAALLLVSFAVNVEAHIDAKACLVVHRETGRDTRSDDAPDRMGQVVSWQDWNDTAPDETKAIGLKLAFRFGLHLASLSPCQQSSITFRMSQADLASPILKEI